MYKYIKSSLESEISDKFNDSYDGERRMRMALNGLIRGNKPECRVASWKAALVTHTSDGTLVVVTNYGDPICRIVYGADDRFEVIVDHEYNDFDVYDTAVSVLMDNGLPVNP